MTKASLDSPQSPVGRIKRLIQVKEYTDDGMSAVEIAKIFGCGKEAIDQDRRYIRELLDLGLTPDAINEKRGEIYLEYCDAGEEAKRMFESYRDDPNAKSTDKKRMFMAWIDTIERKAKLWGFDNVKIDIGAVNTQINQVDYVEKIDRTTKKQIADAIKQNFEREQQEKYEKSLETPEVIVDAD